MIHNGTLANEEPIFIFYLGSLGQLGTGLARKLRYIKKIK